MSQPGWYPDPGGSGQFRFWDGARWAATTSPTPGGPSGPAGPGQQGSGQGGGRGRTGLVLLLVVAILVAGGIGLVLWHPWNRVTDITDNPPTPTVTGGGDGPLTPTPSNNSHAPTPSDSPKPSDTASSGPPVTCDPGDPANRTSSNTAGLMIGGGLSIPVITAANWEAPGPATTPFGWDVSEQDITVVPTSTTSGWYNLVSVGALLKEAGYTSPEQAARLVFSCSITGSWYTARTGVTMIIDKAVTVDGHPAYEISASITETVAEHPEIKGDVVDVVVVDTGAPDRLGVYLSTATIDDKPILDACATTRANLKVV